MWYKGCRRADMTCDKPRYCSLHAGKPWLRYYAIGKTTHFRGGSVGFAMDDLDAAEALMREENIIDGVIFECEVTAPEPWDTVANPFSVLEFEDYWAEELSADDIWWCPAHTYGCKTIKPIKIVAEGNFTICPEFEQEGE